MLSDSVVSKPLTSVEVCHSKARFPDWMKRRWPTGGRWEETKAVLHDLRLNTVCQSAVCPNLCHCFERHHATFLILGKVCTRTCRFCAVTKGSPANLDSTEPQRVAEAVRQLGLRYVVVTSVTRDDLPDGGAAHFAATVGAVQTMNPGVEVEVLVPDFNGAADAVKRVLSAGPTVFGHNVETVPRLYRQARPEANYERSLQVLAVASDASGAITKSGLMLGMGEIETEVLQVMDDLLAAGARILTLGQYLSPTRDHYPVQEFLTPERFLMYKRAALDHGFAAVVSGPLVRSSFEAWEAVRQVRELNEANIAEFVTTLSENNTR